jgi:hypothetical protein
MVTPTKALHQDDICPICDAPLEVVSVQPDVGGVTIDGEERFPAYYRCTGGAPHCWGDFLRPKAERPESAAFRHGFELLPRRCEPDERFAGGR